IFWTMLRHRKNPFAYYPAKKVYQYLSRYHSKQTIDRKIKYSNLGMALLGHILANNLDLSYEQAIINNLCDRLNIQDTRITLNSEQTQRLAIPHSAKGRVSQNWDLNAFAGAGALRSTVNDLMVFLKAQIGILQIDLSEKLKLCHEKYLGTFSKPSKVLSLFPDLVKKRKKFKPYFQVIGLGWIIGNLGLEGPTLHWIHGATGGYMAFIGFIKSSKTGIVILANRGLNFLEEISGISIADEIGFKLLEYLNSI
ncbi:MAG: serine hydrolase domain-containing protein, partial [Promethearchaeota archaeon]